MTPETDEQLVEKYLDGDDKSLEILFSRYLAPIYNFVARTIGNSGNADDITQETFIKTWKNLKKFDRAKIFKVWIFRIARNTAIDYFRKNKEILFSDLDTGEDDFDPNENIADSEPLALGLIEKDEKMDEINRSIDKLPASSRMVIIMHYMEQLTFQEIADISGESINTIKSRNRRALKAIKKFIQKIPE
jgi:RNA polymerase sigma-70 factor, ECF subfamily